MSAIGPKRRILRCNQMSAVGGKADSTWKWRWSILRPNDRELVTVSR